MGGNIAAHLGLQNLKSVSGYVDLLNFGRALTEANHAAFFASQ